jgi:hypothetical protein
MTTALKHEKATLLISGIGLILAGFLFGAVAKTVCLNQLFSKIESLKALPNPGGIAIFIMMLFIGLAGARR